MTDTRPPASLDQIVARTEISDLLYTYSYHLDMNHPERLLELFVEDCEVVYAPNFGARGKVAYAATLQGIGTYFKATSHHVSNVVVTFDGPDRASVRSVLYAMHRYQRERPDGIFWGQYHDEIVRENGRWLFKRRELRATAVENFHVKESLPIGRRV